MTGYLLKMTVVVAALVVLSTSATASTAGGPAGDGAGGPATSEDSRGLVTFNFIDIELPVLAKFVSDVTGKNFIFDEQLKGKITIIAPSKLKIDDAFRLFTSVLELKGFTVTPSGVNAYKIIPSAVAKQKGTAVVSGRLPVNESYIVRLIPLKHISSEEALGFLRPVVSRDGHISAFTPGNLLLLIDSALNIEKVLKIIENIDRPSTVETPEIVYLRHAAAEDVARILNEGLKGMAKSPPRKVPFRSETRVVADTRLNAVVLFGPKGGRESMKRLIALLDVPSPEEQGRINVYFLENADAEELAKVLEGVVKSMETARPPAAKKGVKPPGASARIVITPDEATNSLLIVASPSDYNNLVQVIKKLDRRRRQVYVEAMIVEASIDKLRELGARWRATAKHKGEPVVIGGVGILDPTAIQSVIYGLSGLTAGGMGNFIDIPVIQVDSDGTTTTSTLTVPGFAALFSLEEFSGVVNVLSTPQILTSDNKEAEIVVGENVPFITKRESDPSRTVSVFSSIERKDVGITLRITPQITEGDFVKLDIYQEISSVKQEPNTEVLISVGPTTTKRSTSTSVVVKDNQTVVIGGLMEEKKSATIDKVPLLGDLPLLGWIFKSESLTKEKTNLLVFLTPHIVRDAESMGRITEEKRREFDETLRSASGGEGASGTGGGAKEQPYVSGQILVRFQAGVTEDEAARIIAGQEAKVVKHLRDLDIYLIELPEGVSVEEALEAFNALEEVRYAEPNYTRRLH